MSSEKVFIVDDDDAVRDSLQALLESAGYGVLPFGSAKHLLAALPEAQAACLVTDIRMPEMDGLELQRELIQRKIDIPIIFVTGHGDVPLAVRAMKAGSVDFIEKPYDEEALLVSIQRAISIAAHRAAAGAEQQGAQERIATLTARETDVLKELVAGHPNKVIAYNLGISPRTVEVHRARIMDKLDVRSLSDVIRTALAAGIASD